MQYSQHFFHRGRGYLTVICTGAQSFLTMLTYLLAQKLLWNLVYHHRTFTSTQLLLSKEPLNFQNKFILGTKRLVVLFK